MSSDRCACGSTLAYADCCRPLHHGTRQAATPEELMRSRYSAYALGLADYVFRTWHPRTRPDDVTLADNPTWTGLEVLSAHDDTVEFRARHESGELHEVSRFEQRAGRWFYVDGLTD